MDGIPPIQLEHTKELHTRQVISGQMFVAIPNLLFPSEWVGANNLWRLGSQVNGIFLGHELTVPCFMH